MADLSYKNDSKSDGRLNPYENSGRLSSMESEAGQDSVDSEFDKIANNYDKSADGSTENKNIDKAKNITDTKDGEEAAGSRWKNNVSGDVNPALSSNRGIKSFWAKNKKKSAATAIVTTVLGGGAGLSFLLAPGLGLVHIKEIITGDLNDQLGAMTVRQDTVLRAKLNKVGSGYCGTKITIKCKMSTMSSRELKRFSNAGFTDIKTEKVFLRDRIVSMKSPSGELIANPADILKSNDPALRGALRKAFNPKFTAFSDAVSDKVFGRYRTGKTAKVQGTTLEEQNQSFDEATSGQKYDSTGAKVVETDEKGQYVLDDDGNKIYSDNPNFEAEKAKPPNGKIITAAGNIKPGASAAGSLLKSGAKGVSLIGALDTACTVYNTARAVSAAAKVARSEQLARFAMVFLVTADRIKAGHATPEEVTYIGNNLTKTDTQKTTSDETTISGNLQVSEKENPNYGKAAFDSAGFKVAAYNDAPTLDTRAMQFMVGGGLVGTLSKVTDTLVSVIGVKKENVRSTCKKIQSWWARSIGLIAGVVSAIGTFGTSTLVTVGASVAIGFALPFLTAALADILAGTVVSSATTGVDSGNAMFAGSAAIMGTMAMSRGMKPATKSDLKSYMAVSQQVKNDYIAIETYDAKSEPLNVYNQYSLLGSVSRSLLPFAQNVKKQPVVAMLSSPGLLLDSLKNLSPSTGAAVSPYSEERFSKCPDEGYAELGIDADIFCNVRYTMSSKELMMDPITNVDWMVTNGHIDEDGVAISESFKNWIRDCVDRQDGWGESQDENGSLGKECMENSDQLSHFRVFQMDNGVVDGLENDPKRGSSSTAETTPPTDGGSATLPTGSEQELASKILANSKITLSGNVKSQILNISRGSLPIANYDQKLNPRILQLIAGLGEKYSFTVSSMMRTDRCAFGNSSCTSRHPLGQAVDFSSVNGKSTSPYSQDIQNFYNDGAALLPDGCGQGAHGSILSSVKKTKCRVYLDNGTGPHIHMQLN